MPLACGSGSMATMHPVTAHALHPLWLLISSRNNAFCGSTLHAMGLHDVNSHANVLLCTSVRGILPGPLFDVVSPWYVLRQLHR